ncbi:hypothetical protein OIU85_018728 [Salix viminalis]|uniref:Uncharacterized protein n=1 Tax=Salix viminalis TaxID=40686 RepID=A0A9Q0ZJB1_SALVM|nr:hypothetical protein OIU85_018728 [Salix viminalis]
MAINGNVNGTQFRNAACVTLPSLKVSESRTGMASGNGVAFNSVARVWDQLTGSQTDSKKSKDASVFFDDDVFGMANIFISILNLAVSLSSLACIDGIPPAKHWAKLEKIRTTYSAAKQSYQLVLPAGVVVIGMHCLRFPTKS